MTRHSTSCAAVQVLDEVIKPPVKQVLCVTKALRHQLPTFRRGRRRAAGGLGGAGLGGGTMTVGTGFPSRG